MHLDPAEANGRRENFWASQVGLSATPAQLVFDFLVGVIAPLPYVLFLVSVLGQYRIFPALCFGLGLLTLAIWLFSGSQVTVGHGCFVGILWLGALVTALIGLISLFLLPLAFGVIIFIGWVWVGFASSSWMARRHGRSVGALWSAGLVGLTVGLWVFGRSLLGFDPVQIQFMFGSIGFCVAGALPLAMGFVYWRNGFRALRRMRQIQPAVKRRVFAGAVTLGLVAALGMPLFLQWQALQFVDRSVQQIIHGDTQLGVQSLKAAFWCEQSCYADIRWTYQKTEGSTERARLADAYRELTGQDIQDAINMYSD